ncbi:efflux MFS transporter permease [Sphingobacterium litopenaei]|uniref:Beta-carotene 15,15'-monooxygenase n=1 Tax=Sphingobacterium litopenaei TaxID=2763500 RepID=A0ABR7YDK4_9SPHI|nr:beta-carotene 15,15'-monooxygenase [Sphingobacterium litopenaei]MBD1429399.1 beta-carotene 15,15'-monooxygenase [Sphingobacterium litopenaei]
MKGIFKEWVPEWLIKLILFSGLMPSMVLFFLPGANINVTAGYYGCQPSDVQLLIVLFYAGFVGFYILERRFFQFFPVKHYYIIFNILQILNCLLMHLISDIEWVYGLRFFQGMLFASAVNLSISMIFSRLKSERAKEGSYAVFFGMLLCSSPFNTFVTADFIDSFNFDEIYFYAAISFVPGLIMIMLTMRSIRQAKPYPLFSLDWGSFILYSLLIVSFGYMMVYGQEVYWFSDSKMLIALILFISLTLIFTVRQNVLKRICIHMGIFKSRNFLLGLLVLYMMYIERFSLSIANQYFLQVLHLDPIHLSYIQWFNILGIVCGVVFSMYWILAKRSVKWMWSFGYISLLTFHQIMFFSFESDGNDYYFFIPLVIHGLGVGLIMVPTILFVISSVKTHFGVSAAAVCLAIRYLGYTTSIGLQNFFKLFENSQHQEAFGSQLQPNNPIFREYLSTEAGKLMNQGLQYKEHAAAIKLIAQRVRNEAYVRYAMDYYELMSLISICLLVLILFSPSLKTMYNKLKQNLVSPA